MLAFVLLEPCAPKGACTVARGLGAGNRAWLPYLAVTFVFGHNLSFTRSYAASLSFVKHKKQKPSEPGSVVWR